ncbi:MAG: amidohydrolase [Alicyclobacillus sp.]|nr:amidohydrolase [Alicyclobacillus sp.]
MSDTDYRLELAALIESRRETFTDLSDHIWDLAETRFEEFQSAELLCQALEAEGFHVERGVGGMETAFIGQYGSGSPVIAILGEFDALSGLSQKPGVTAKDPLEPGGNGHGCGHNLLGTGALAAAVAVRRYMEAHELPGTVRYYGCPGEEGGSGKAFMARAGLFDDIDVCFTWHPAWVNGIMEASSLANYQVYFKFHGVSSHAAGSPHLGRSALDAVELMNVGVNYLREHVIPEARMHYAVTNSGGRSPNVVQSEAEVLYLLRAPKVSQVEEIYQRVCDIARGAALMTGTQVDIVFDKACSNLVPNRTLEQVMHRHFTALGLPEYTPEEEAFAQGLVDSLSEQERRVISAVAPDLMGKGIADGIRPLDGPPRGGKGSTDVGDVSWIAPTAQCQTATWAVGTPGHSWQVVTIGKTSIAHKGMLQAAKVIAASAVEVLTNPEIVETAKAELRERLNGASYVCPIPPDVQPSAVK